MNFVQEKRQEILKENNNAQTFIESFLATIESKSIHRLVINEKINGEIDFSVLKKLGFLNIKEIEFEQPGEITSITNLPSNLEIFKCNSQLLTELHFVSPLKRLIELECTNNYLQMIDLKNTPVLEKLDLTNNKLESLENLPKTIVSLILDGNNVKNINLENMHKLRVFHINNNKTVIIQNLPSTVSDFLCQNNPFIEVYRDDVSVETGSEKKNHGKKVAFIEALNDYFKLKNKYETYVKTQKKKVFDKFKKEKNIKVAKKMAASVSLKCIHCKQEGGTIFKHKDNMYMALCGNNKSPCNLKIEIFSGVYYYNENILKSSFDKLISLKKDIITKKLEISYKYKHPREIAAEYKTIMEDYNYYKEEVDEFLKLHEELFYSDEKKEKIKKKSNMIFEIVNEINVLIEEYKKNGNTQLLKSAIDMQIHQLNPEIHNLRTLKHEIMEMKLISETKKKKFYATNDDDNDDDDEKTYKCYFLFQKPITLQKMESNAGDNENVASYQN
jgi:hypothetical protein